MIIDHTATFLLVDLFGHAWLSRFVKRIQPTFVVFDSTVESVLLDYVFDYTGDVLLFEQLIFRVVYCPDGSLQLCRIQEHRHRDTKTDVVNEANDFQESMGHVLSLPRKFVRISTPGPDGVSREAYAALEHFFDDH